MQTITVEPIRGKRLGEVAEQAVLCDERGRVLGLFSPFPDLPQVGDLQLEPSLSIEETETLRQKRDGKPLEEILKRLGH